MRFLLDEDLNPEAAEVARGLGMDVVSVHEIDRRALPDVRQLRFAAREGRILVTRNRDDFIQLTVGFYRKKKPHCGVLIVPRSLPNHQPELMAHALKKWLESCNPLEEPPAYMIDFLSR